MLFGAFCIPSNLVADGRLLTNHLIILHASHSCSLDEHNIDHVVHVYPFDVYSICLRIFFLPVRYSFTNLIWFVVFFNMFFLNFVCCINHPSRCSFKKLVISGSDFVISYFRIFPSTPAVDDNDKEKRLEVIYVINVLC